MRYFFNCGAIGIDNITFYRITAAGKITVAVRGINPILTSADDVLADRVQTTSQFSSFRKRCKMADRRCVVSAFIGNIIIPPLPLSLSLTSSVHPPPPVSLPSLSAFSLECTAI